MSSPLDIINKAKEKAKLDSFNDYKKSLAIKFNKAGKVKMQLLALDEENLFRLRQQHFIPKHPNSDDPNEKILLIDCQGEDCPICSAVNAFKNSGVTLEEVNDAYNNKYPYRNLKSVFTQPEHVLICARILADGAEEGKYLPNDAAIGETQLIQISRSCLNSLLTSYEDFLDEASDNDEDIDNLAPLFGTVNDADKNGNIKSLTVNLRVQVQGSWSYLFSFGKPVEVNKNDINMDKLNVIISGANAVTEDYMNSAIKRINDIKNYFIGGSLSISPEESPAIASAKRSINAVVDDDEDKPVTGLKSDNDDDVDFDIDSL